MATPSRPSSRRVATQVLSMATRRTTCSPSRIFRVRSRRSLRLSAPR
jgi:hypothetical protein